MKTRTVILLGVLILHSAMASLFAQVPPQVTIDRGKAAFELSWPATFAGPNGESARPLFELQRSADLRQWRPFGERRRARAAGADQRLRATMPIDEPLGFFRLLQLEAPAVGKLGQGGGEVFGYSEAFQTELERIGQISPEQFEAMFPNQADYLPGISWDPTTASFWDLFNANLAEVNRGKEEGKPGYRYFDTRLNARELALFRKNGFVVSERLGSHSFGSAFYWIWKDDLPVFISCDAILQAWHRTYDAMLEEIEETYLFNSVEKMIEGMAAQLAAAASEAGDGPLKESLRDADYFLAVARSLLASPYVPPPTGRYRPPPAETKWTIVPSIFDQDARVAETLADVKAEQLKQVADFMGFCRVVDFSQFKVRGHYTHSARLGRYFRCLMWLGRIDIPVAGGPWERCPDVLRFASPRELGTAIVLWHLLNASGQFDRWRDMEQTISGLVGTTDSLNVGQLAGLLAGAGIRTLADVRDLSTLERLQADIVRGELGVQNIRSDWFEQPLTGPVRYVLPQTFTVFGQKFVPDSWAFSQTVFSSILWVENGETNKVQRRVPGALDVAFAVLGNDQVVPELVAQMKGTFPTEDRPHAAAFRDGLPYQHNLAAVRAVMDRHDSAAWESNIYMRWLAGLRELSAPTTEARFPEAMRTRAWAMKTLNTQLSSWTHLRHDTILYAKQSYTAFGNCTYPAGFIEPRIEFWRRLGETLNGAASLLAALKYEGTYSYATNHPAGWTETNVVSLAEIQARQVSHIRQFAAVVDRLETLAGKELAQECFSPEDDRFIDTLMEDDNLVGFVCGGTPYAFTGWYPNLFYRTIYWTDAEFHFNYGSDAFDALVADVHTDVPNEVPPDPGSVLHEAVGRVNLLMLAVDNGSDRFVCAGPVLSHYEFEVTGNPRRLSDQEWQYVMGGGFPEGLDPKRLEGLQPPPWTRSYLAPQTP
jgi:hypothetical protein